MPAGHAVLTLIIAFAVAALLNAQGMHKSALSQPPGIQRDVGGTLTAGLAALSGVLQTDEPRALLKSALGRAGDDRINTKVVFDAPRRRAAATTARPAKPLYTPAHPMRPYVTGDSLITDPGPVILDRTAQDPAVKAVAATDTHPATGLVQPAVFNWFAYLPQQIDDLKPDLSVVTFGANDGLGFDDVAGAEDFGTPQWQAEYRRRVAGVMDTFVDRHSKLVWVGLPIPRDEGGRVVVRTLVTALRRGELKLHGAWRRPGLMSRLGRVMSVDG